MVDRRALILAAGTFAIGTDAFVVAGILPDIGRDLSQTIENCGLVVSVFAVSYALGSPVVSALGATWRRKTVLVWGMAVFMVANLLSAAAPTLPLLLASRILAALSAGLFAPAAYAMGASLGPPAMRGRTLAVVVAGFSTAIVAGVPLGVIIGQHAGWRGTLVFVAAVAGSAALAIALATVPEPAGEPPPAGLRQRLRPVAEARTLSVLFPFLLWSMANYALYTFVAPLFGQHLPPGAIPLLLSLFGAGGIVGNLVGGALGDRFGPDRPALAGLAVLVGVLAAAQAAGRTLAGAAVEMLVWSVLMAALYTLQQQRAIAVDPQQANLRLALNNSAMYLGASIGAAAGGMVIAAAGLDRLPWASAGFAAAGWAALALLTGRIRRGAAKRAVATGNAAPSWRTTDG